MQKLIERMRMLEEDHAPDGWPAVKMRDVSALLDEIERLRAWIEPDATCPCCEKSDLCADGCTFSEDCPDDFERMLEARKILRISAIEPVC